MFFLIIYHINCNTTLAISRLTTSFMKELAFKIHSFASLYFKSNLPVLLTNEICHSNESLNFRGYIIYITSTYHRDDAHHIIF